MTDEMDANRLRKRERKSALFTDRYIKSLKPEAKMYQVREGRGFAIRVLPSGVKTWYYVYNFNGKRRQLNLGNYPNTTLEDAHTKYRDAITILKEGRDPQVQLEPETQIEPAFSEKLTLFELADLYEEHIRQHLVAKSVIHQRRTLDIDILPVLGALPAVDIRRKDAIALVEAVARRAPGQGRNVIKTARAMFSFALIRDLVEQNPFAGVGRAVPVTAPKSRRRTLSDEEINKIWSQLKASINGRIILLVLVTGQRPGEVTGMRWDEIDGHWWTIPCERSKNDRENRVFLTAWAKKLLPLPIEGEAHVFPAQGRGRGIGAQGGVRPGTLSHFITDNGYFELARWTPHDLRRTLATGLGSLGCTDEIINEVLNHKKKGVIGVYNRHRYDMEKRRWLIAWAWYLRKITRVKKKNGIINGKKDSDQSLS